jgi:hypothetical protein
MSQRKAKAHFLGQSGHQKLNCGQAVVSAFREKFLVPDDVVVSFGQWGGGKAPDGHCGAYYAVKVILEKKSAEKFKEFSALFTDHAGSDMCKDIRSHRKITCLGCVELAARFLEENL